MEYYDAQNSEYKVAGTYWMGGYVGPGADLVALEKRKILVA